MIVSEYLKGHVGRRRETVERVHGGWEVGETNVGERLIDLAVAFDLAIVKKANHLVTYSSG